MKKILFGLFVLVGGIGFSGCLKSKDPGCPYTDSNRKAPDSQVVKVKNYLDSVAVTDYKLDSASGVFYKIVNPGTTTSPAVCSVITFTYEGRLTDANRTVFDKSPAGSPSTLWLGDLIVGWQKGLKYIKGGGKITLYIPPYLGYGDVDVKDQVTGAVRIPAKSILVFDVDLLSVQ